MRFKEELELTWKMNPMYKQDQQLNKIQEKHQKRMQYLQKNIDEKKAAQQEQLKKYMRQKDRELAMLYMDDDEIERAQKTGEYYIPL